MTGNANERQAATGDHGSLSSGLKRWAPIIVILVAMIVSLSMGWHHQLSLSNLIMQRVHLQTLVGDNLVLALLAYGAVYVVATSLSFPGGSLMTIIGGFLFGWFIGGCVTILSATLGATILFLAARSSLGTALRARAGPFLSKLSAGFRDNAMSYLLFLRLVPLFPFWVVNLAPALLDVPLRTYVIATLAGIVPGTFAYAIIGGGLDSVIVAQEAANPGCAASGTCRIDAGSLITTELLVAFAALGVVSLIPIVLKAWRRRGGQDA